MIRTGVKENTCRVLAIEIQITGKHLQALHKYAKWLAITPPRMVSRLLDIELARMLNPQRSQINGW